MFDWWEAQSQFLKAILSVVLLIVVLFVSCVLFITVISLFSSSDPRSSKIYVPAIAEWDILNSEDNQSFG